MSGIMSGHVGAMKKKGPSVPVYANGGIKHPIASFLGKQYVISTKAFGGTTGKSWGSYGTTRGTTSTTNGKAASDTLYLLGPGAHPAAYFCRALSGGSAGSYADWYLPAKDELNHVLSAKDYIATNFPDDAYVVGYHWSSTEQTGKYAWMQHTNGTQLGNTKNYTAGPTRAVRSYP